MSKYRVQVTIKNKRVLLFCDGLFIDNEGNIEIAIEQEGEFVETAYFDGTVWTEFTVEAAE